jgi:hypothetical protein
VTPASNRFDPLRQHEQQNKHKANSPLEDTELKRFCDNEPNSSFIAENSISNNTSESVAINMISLPGPQLTGATVSHVNTSGKI